MWVGRFGEEPAEENEVSERGFKLTLAVVCFAAAVGQGGALCLFQHCPGFASLPDALAGCGR